MEGLHSDGFQEAVFPEIEIKKIRQDCIQWRALVMNIWNLLPQC